MNDLITICMHTGKLNRVYLMQNAIKSFIATNKYPNIELLLIETGQNKKVRDWIENLDVNNFKNFNGSISTIKPHTNVNIEIKNLFLDYENHNNLFSKSSAPFVQSIDNAIKESSGKYFVYLAEDHQYVVEGDVLIDYIKLLKHLGEDRSMIHFVTHQYYKYSKVSNAFKGPSLLDDIIFFTPDHVKWDQNVLCNKDAIYSKLGPVSDWDQPHGTNRHYTNIASKKGLKRYYFGIAPAMWFHNNDLEKHISKIILETERDPNFILYKSIKYKDAKNAFKLNVEKLKRPLSTEDFETYNEVKKWKKH